MIASQQTHPVTEHVNSCENMGHKTCELTDDWIADLQNFKQNVKRYMTKTLLQLQLI